MGGHEDWAPRLVAVDADGTIVGSDDLVPTPLAHKLGEIAASGVPVVLVTGRAWLSAQLVLDQLQIPDMYCVCNNGATVVRYPPLEMIQNTCFDPTRIIDVIRNHSGAIVAVEDFGRGYKVSAPFPPGAYNLHGELRVVPLDELASEPVSRIILRSPGISLVEFEDLITELDLGDLYRSMGAVNWLDIGAEGVGKDTGLALAAQALEVVQADILAIGDGGNDIDLLSWAGRGVALGGSSSELVAVADDVVASFAEGGTLDELNKWFT